MIVFVLKMIALVAISVVGFFCLWFSTPWGYKKFPYEIFLKSGSLLDNPKMLRAIGVGGIFYALLWGFWIIAAKFTPSTDGFTNDFDRALNRKCEWAVTFKSPTKNQLPGDIHEKSLREDACVCFIKGINDRLSWRQLGIFHSGQAKSDEATLAVVQSELNRCAEPLVEYWATLK
jgi:hypothetical protein